jgi:hypothetical protein
VRPLRLLPGLAGVATALLVACGSSPAGGPGSHASPEGAVRGFLDAVADNDVPAALGWIPPRERPAAAGLLNGSEGVKVTFTVRHVDVGAAAIDGSHPDQAQVPISGQASACVNGGSGDNAALNTCFPFSKFAQTAASDRVACVRIGGQWYVDFGSSGDSSSPETGGTPPPATPGAAAPGSAPGR